ncbi:pyridoxamine 5'-phosphate oxidase family protein [Kitasatospora sp. NPDC004745]|uniref:pyridoxamine 5'-phosphate oxidase family protein n=1 Tax=Kitasatospora sp. NPDC004745 TaxID=3364019 RepID=UPI00369643B0
MRNTHENRPVDPGDLSRRVAHRRTELGLTRKQVADRARLDPGFLEHLETNPVPVGVGTLTRLADALDTTVTDLLGGGRGVPAGAAPANASVQVEELDRAACWAKLVPGGVGRVVLRAPAGLAALPVNYRVLDATVVCRTAAGGALAGAAGDEVAFEVDRLDEAFATGWSVLLNGTLSVVSDQDAAQWFRQHADPDPWAGGRRDVWMRIKPTVITGRIIRPDGPSLAGSVE